MITFRCKNCGRKISVPEIHAGKRGTCPKCKNTVVIPKVENPQPRAGQSNSGGLETISKNSDIDSSLFDIPQKSKVAGKPAAHERVPDKTLEDLRKLEERMGTEKTEPEPVAERKLPSFIDVLLYPASLHGIIQIAIFLVASFLIDLLGRFIFSYARHYGSFLSTLLYVLLVGYIFYYFAYCIFDSSRGGRRAPDIRAEHIPDKEDFISQLFLILGCVAVCFWPVAVYYVFARRTDSIFWALAGCGGFFFPIALLRGVLFDAFDALNPIFIIGSIFRTFLSYCGLILSFCVFGGLVAAIVFFLRRLPVLGFISNAVNLYLLFVAAHLLGRFYWWHKDKLDWGI